MRHRVVVTGIGAVSPFGLGVSTAWNALLAGHTASRNMLKLPEWSRLHPLFERISCQVAAPVLCIPPSTSDTFRQPRQNVFALLAAQEALKDARLEDSQSVGIFVGCGMPGLEQVEDVTLGSLANRRIRTSPYLITSVLGSTPAAAIAKQFSITGPIVAPSSACATGLQALGEAYLRLQTDDDRIDAIIAGATEAPLNAASILGFHSLRALSYSFSATPSSASRPFDQARDGFVMGEGAAILVLERLSSAVRRNAKIYAEIAGYGSSTDPDPHPTAPDPNGQGIICAMKQAVRNIDSGLIKAVYAHATGTPIGDRIELQAISSLFNKQKLTAFSTKGSTGHLLGASGSFEAAISAMILDTGLIPSMSNLLHPLEAHHNITFPSSESPLKVLSIGSSRWGILKNASGFGGINVSVAILTPPSTL